MTYPGVVTSVYHKLPMINMVFMNLEYAFIKNRYEDTNKNSLGTDFTDVNRAQVNEAQGAKGFMVSRIEDTDWVMQEAVVANKVGHVVVVDCKITTDRPIPVETLKLNPKLFSESEISTCHKEHEVQYPVPSREFLKAEGLKSQYIK